MAEKYQNLLENKDYAVFLPSISSLYSRMVSKGDANLKRQVPATYGSIDYLNFLDATKGAYDYPYALYSAGHAELDIERSNDKESMIQDRDRSRTVIVGDSGGYQVATGVISMDWSNQAAIDEKWLKIMRWLEHTADYSMILDMPTSAIDHPKATTIHQIKQCYEFTERNIETLMKHRVPKATKFLNVVQGRTSEESYEWFQYFRKYNDRELYGDRALEGWAFAGNSVKDLYVALKIILDMVHDGSIKDVEWIHFLGIGKLNAALVYTDIQRMLRKHNPDITISFDAASPFVSAAKGRIYTDYVMSGEGKGRLVHKMTSMPDEKSLVGSTDPWPFDNSPFINKLTIGDLCCNGDDKYKSSWDGMSYGFLMAHSTYLHVKSIQHANYIYSMYGQTKKTDSFVRQFIPKRVFEIREFIESMFAMIEDGAPLEAVHHELDMVKQKLKDYILGSYRRVQSNTIADSRSLLFAAEPDAEEEVEDIEGESVDPVDDKEFARNLEDL